MSASYGVARWPEDGPDDDAVLAAADLRLYAMKGERGRRASRTSEAADSPPCCLSRPERVAVLSRLSRRLSNVDDIQEVVRTSIEELGSGFSCYSPTLVAGSAEGSESEMPIEPTEWLRPCTIWWLNTHLTSAFESNLTPARVYSPAQSPTMASRNSSS